VITDRLKEIAFGLRALAESLKPKRVRFQAQSDERVLGVKHRLFRVVGRPREVVYVKFSKKEVRQQLEKG